MKRKTEMNRPKQKRRQRRQIMKRKTSRTRASDLQVDGIDSELEIVVDDTSTDLYEIIYTLEGLIEMEEGEYCELPGSMRPSRGGEPSQKDRLRVLSAIRLLYDAQRKLLELE
jgi:hypothetical protein